LNNLRIDELLITFGAITANVISLPSLETIAMTPIGYVKRKSTTEDERDRSHVVCIVVEDELAPALTGIDEWSHVYIIFHLHQASLDVSELATEGGVAARSPKHPNSIGLTLVELLKHERNMLWVKGLDAIAGIFCRRGGFGPIKEPHWSLAGF
jgi:tRNA (Thr-GGU) A37 N-methylase